jgi:hypothetical protein
MSASCKKYIFLIIGQTYGFYYLHHCLLTAFNLIN